MAKLQGTGAGGGKSPKKVAPKLDGKPPAMKKQGKPPVMSKAAQTTKRTSVPGYKVPAKMLKKPATKKANPIAMPSVQAVVKSVQTLDPEVKDPRDKVRASDILKALTRAHGGDQLLALDKLTTWMAKHQDALHNDLTGLGAIETGIEVANPPGTVL
jgi:transposase-like protein